jgi:hypothetical protein
MNTLQAEYLHFQDFDAIPPPKSGLMSNILNTLRKLEGGLYQFFCQTSTTG